MITIRKVLGDRLQNSKQWLDYSIDLTTLASELIHEKVSKMSFHLILLLPSSLIATDVRTGFPQLLSIERQRIKHLLTKQIRLIQLSSSQSLDNLSQYDRLITDCSQRLKQYFSEHSHIDLDSLEVEISYFL